MRKLFRKLVQFKGRLTGLGVDEPLSKLSLAVLIALDIFVLTMVFNGLSDHTRQLTDPGEYLPYSCRNAFLDNGWNRTNRLDKLQQMVLSGHNNYSHRYNNPYRESELNKMHPLCQDYFRQIKEIRQDKALYELFVQRRELVDHKRDVRRDFSKAKGFYDTSLLREIAGKEKIALATVEAKIKTQSGFVEVLSSQISLIEQQLNAHDKVKQIWLITSKDSERRKQLIVDYKRFQFAYSIKKLAWQLVFMVPLFVFFYVWSSRSVKKGNRVRTLISSHLLVVVSIPIILKVIEVILDLIPNVFFKKLFAILESLNLMGLWHYVVMLGAVGVALFSIWLIQKKIFNKERVQLKRLTKGLCYHCGRKLPEDVTHCPCCGQNQYEECGVCKADTFVAAHHCTSCGAEK